MAILPEAFDLTGKTALVTGSSRGIGRAIAEALAAAGAHVIVHGTRDSAALHEAVAACGANAAAVTAELGQPGAVAAMLAQCQTPPDIVVLNASVQSYIKIDEFDEAELMREYAVNLAANFEIMKALLPAMRAKRWGRILAIGSVNAIKPSPRLSIYATTKAALANLIRTCARENAQYGITANIMHPGIIRTDRNSQVLSDHDFAEKALALVPAARFGTPQDCTGLALLLCSDAGSYLTGAEIPIAGGMDL